MKQTIFLLSALAIIAGSCGKRANVNGDIKQRCMILMTHKWVLVSKEVNGANQPIKECEKDNYFVFDTASLGRWEEGAMNCLDTGSTENGVVPTYTDFRWYITADQRELYIKDFGQIGHDPEWEITNMDYSSMDVTTSERIDGVYYLYKYKFVTK